MGRDFASAGTSLHDASLVRVETATVVEVTGHSDGAGTHNTANLDASPAELSAAGSAAPPTPMSPEIQQNLPPRSPSRSPQEYTPVAPAGRACRSRLPCRFPKLKRSAEPQECRSLICAYQGTNWTTRVRQRSWKVPSIFRRKWRTKVRRPAGLAARDTLRCPREVHHNGWLKPDARPSNHRQEDGLQVQ